MATTPITAKQQHTAPGPRVELMEIDLTRLGGSRGYFTPSVREDQEFVTFGGIVYTAVPMTIKGFERSGKDPFPRPHVIIGNVNLVASALVRDYRDLVGARIRHMTTFEDYLDDGADPDSGQYFPVNIYRVERKVRQTRTMIEFELSTAIDQQGRKLPGRQALRMCPLRYRVFNPATGALEYDQTERACTYNGDACYDRNNQPVAVSEDRCAHTIPACKQRFGQYADLIYGGFPAIGLSI